MIRLNSPFRPNVNTACVFYCRTLTQLKPGIQGEDPSKIQYAAWGEKSNALVGGMIWLTSSHYCGLLIGCKKQYKIRHHLQGILYGKRELLCGR